MAAELQGFLGLLVADVYMPRSPAAQLGSAAPPIMCDLAVCPFCRPNAVLHEYGRPAESATAFEPSKRASVECRCVLYFMALWAVELCVFMCALVTGDACWPVRGLLSLTSLQCCLCHKDEDHMLKCALPAQTLALHGSRPWRWKCLIHQHLGLSALPMQSEVSPAAAADHMHPPMWSVHLRYPVYSSINDISLSMPWLYSTGPQPTDRNMMCYLVK